MRLTRIRVACQTAFSASQRCGWSGKWNAVIVLQIKNKRYNLSLQIVLRWSLTPAVPTHQWYPGL